MAILTYDEVIDEMQHVLEEQYLPDKMEEFEGDDDVIADVKETTPKELLNSYLDGTLNGSYGIESINMKGNNYKVEYSL